MTRSRFLLLAGGASFASALALLVHTLPVNAGTPAQKPAPKAAPAPVEAKPAAPSAEQEAQAFLSFYNPMYERLSTVAAEAAWKASTDVKPEHEGERTGAGKAWGAFAGNRVIIEKVRALLARKAELQPLTVRQLERIMLMAAEAPGTIPDVVNRRVELESRQSSLLDGWQFCLQRDKKGACAKPTDANGIDKILVESKKLPERLTAWNAAKEVGTTLRPGILQLREVRNQVAREMGHSSFFALQVADYRMSVPEMMTLLDQLLVDTRPLYEQIHCYAKHTLAQRYGVKEVPQKMPAHWLGNRWAQAWPGIVEGVDADAPFKGKTPEWIVKSAEAFYVGIGFPTLPDGFWKKSDLYPVEKGNPRKKNSHASAWHMDLGSDVRSLMSVESNSYWFGTTHHELGHIYYYVSYTRPDVPPVLREGANRSFHEGMGDLMAIAAGQQPYLEKMGLVQKDKPVSQEQWLLEEAMESIVFIPWGAGVMSHYEHDLYEKNLPEAELNKRWWDYVAQYQGIVPPAARDESTCDACTKTHINDDPAQYYDYALASIVKYQLHDHICRKILGKDPHACDYSGNKAVGEFLQGIMKLGATRDWREVIQNATGKALSTQPLAEYYAPVLAYLKKQNEGRQCGF
ncbi:MAG: M2 family metallopeptidase [Myxococcota bacterium]